MICLFFREIYAQEKGRGTAVVYNTLLELYLRDDEEVRRIFTLISPEYRSPKL